MICEFLEWQASLVERTEITVASLECLYRHPGIATFMSHDQRQ